MSTYSRVPLFVIVSTSIAILNFFLASVREKCIFNAIIVCTTLLASTGQKLLKKCQKKRNIFLVSLTIPELISREIFLIHVQLPGGAAIIFAQSWNFDLKFFVDNPFMQKINSTGMGSHFLPKKCSKEPKTRNQKLYQCLEKD